jgi:hypothetical protein
MNLKSKSSAVDGIIKTSLEFKLKAIVGLIPYRPAQVVNVITGFDSFIIKSRAENLLSV